MRWLFQRYYLFKLTAWKSRTLGFRTLQHSCGRIGNGAIFAGMESGTCLQKGVELLTRGLLLENMLPRPSPLKVTSWSQLGNFAFYIIPPFHIHVFRTVPQEIIFPEQIVEVSVPNSLPFHGNVIGDKGTDVAIGDATSDKTMLDLCSTLKRRIKKMKKHKFRKKRKRDLFKRRNIENTRARKKRAKERKDERRRQREA